VNEIHSGNVTDHLIKEVNKVKSNCSCRSGAKALIHIQQIEVIQEQGYGRDGCPTYPFLKSFASTQAKYNNAVT
jgi:hypothetical protein